MKKLLCMLLAWAALAAHGTEFDYRLTPKAVAPDVYVFVGKTEDFDTVNGGNIVNTGFIVAPEGVVVIDTGPSRRYGEQMREAIDLADGRRYIADAVQRGAVAVFWQPGGDFDFGQNIGLTVANLPVDALRPLAGPLAHMVYGHPSENLSLIAITGTNGKTTISQCLARAYPKPCAIIGTLGAGFPDALVETGFTTPEATTLMRYLAEFRAKHAAACALEASSIGIEEGRMNGARVDVAVFTNFTRDHLDYHGSMEAYADAKEKLFHWPRLRTAIDPVVAR